MLFYVFFNIGISGQLTQPYGFRAVLHFYRAILGPDCGLLGIPYVRCCSLPSPRSLLKREEKK